MKRRRYSAAAVVFFVLMTAVYFVQERMSPPVSRPKTADVAVEYVPVIKVFDGDTVVISVRGQEEKVRLIGIDAPEMAQRPWGKRSKAQLETMLENADRKVSMEQDIEPRDKYGRLLAYLFLPDGKMVNEEMLKTGFAMLYTFPPNVKYVNRLTTAQEQARLQGLGVWGRGGLKEKPSDFRKGHPRR